MINRKLIRIEIQNTPPCPETGDRSDVIFKKILKELNDHNFVAVSFKGIRKISTSFIDRAFVPLLDHYPLDYIESNVKFADSTVDINTKIKKYMRR